MDAYGAMCELYGYLTLNKHTNGEEINIIFKKHKVRKNNEKIKILEKLKSLLNDNENITEMITQYLLLNSK